MKGNKNGDTISQTGNGNKNPDNSNISPASEANMGDDGATVMHTRERENKKALNPGVSPDNKNAVLTNRPILKQRFELQSVLGSGGMGTVYKARDLRKIEAQDLEPFVAVKVLGEKLRNNSDAFIALQREAKKSQKLAHPNILTVHDFDRDGDVTFLTMELLHGESLDKLLTRHKGVGLPYKNAIRIIKDFCAALGYAHQHGIIHLDFKPGNIFVTKENTKVLDFGIARLTTDKKDPKDFDAGSLNALTPAYASLEMLNWQDPDPRDDVYAAAVICYEMLSGEHPYGKKPANQALAEKLHPKRIKTLKKRQWKALESALMLTRNARTPSIKQFIEAFTQSKKLYFIRAAAVLVLTAIGGWLTYDSYFVPDELTKMVEKTMGKANKCFAEKDYLCATENAKAVVNMDPTHTAASRLLTQAQQANYKQDVDNILMQGDNCLKKDDLACVLAYIDKLMKKDSTHKNIERWQNQVNSKKQHLAANADVSKAQACLEAKDFQCAIAKSNAVLALEADNKTALKVKETAQQEISARNKEAERIAALIESKLLSAAECYNQKKYECVVENADVVLVQKPGDESAVTLKQKALFALQVIDENQKRVNKILNTGRSCINRKDFSCAIAKSESALEIIPNHEGAIALKNEATVAIKKLKDSITIQ